MTTAGTVGTSRAQWIMFTPWDLLTGQPAWKLSPLTTVHHLGGTWHTVGWGVGVGGHFLAASCFVPISWQAVTQRQRRLILGVSVEQEESVGTLWGLGELGSVTSTMTSTTDRHCSLNGKAPSGLVCIDPLPPAHRVPQQQTSACFSAVLCALPPLGPTACPSFCLVHPLSPFSIPHRQNHLSDPAELSFVLGNLLQTPSLLTA